MSLKLTFVLCLIPTCAMAAACSSSPPPELLTARAAYQRAANGPASQLDPAQLHEAKQSLTIAEQTFEDEGKSDKTRDRAYVAIRKAQLAETRARLAGLEREAAEAERRAKTNLAQQSESTQRQLTLTKEQLAAQTAQVEAERQGRAEAERRAQEAVDALGKVASVRQEERGTVITISGSVLFPSGKADILPGARSRLNEVATALSKQEKGRRIIVEGHTDSKGSDALNQKLSEQRAEQVRSYLVSRGVEADRVSARGAGSSRPIADNSTPEGRANNRRVEIIVEAAPKT